MTIETQPAQKPNKFLSPKANLSALMRLTVLVAILIGGVCLFLRYTGGEKTADRLAATVLRQRVNLADVVEDLPSSSFKGVPLSLPYTGSLSVEIAVVRGNEISVYLVAPDQIEKLKAKQGFEHIEGFAADKTKSYRRSGRVAAGSYYLVLIDKTLGILAQKSSDVQVRAQLDP